MIGNISKTRGILGATGPQGKQGIQGPPGPQGERGEPFTYDMFSPEQLASLKGEKGDQGNQGIQGEKGDKGNMVAISLRLDEKTGNLYYCTDGILVNKEYVNTDHLLDMEKIGNVANLKTTSKNIVAAINELFDLAVTTKAFVNILGGAENWMPEEVKNTDGDVIGYRYGQVVNVNNAVITPNSKVDLQITSQQMVIFHEKDLAFVAEQEDGVVTIYCIGQIPEYNYRLQATVTEVETNA